MTTNFLPFARRAIIQVPVAVNGRPGEMFTRVSDLGTGGAIRAHLQDVIVEQPIGVLLPQYDPLTQGGDLRMRIGIHGKGIGFLTEELYDYRCYCDGQTPIASVWNWKKPYRIGPGKKLHVMISAPLVAGATTFNGTASVLFNCKTADGKPYLLYQAFDFVYNVANFIASQGISLGDCVLNCPSDTELDIFGVSLSGWNNVVSPAVYIMDGDERPFWTGKTWSRIIDPLATPILLGPEWTMTPGEVLTLDFENWNTAAEVGANFLPVTVTLRGVLEVDDGR